MTIKRRVNRIEESLKLKNAQQSFFRKLLDSIDGLSMGPPFKDDLGSAEAEIERLISDHPDHHGELQALLDRIETERV